jgi:hypothetical protein
MSSDPVARGPLCHVHHDHGPGPAPSLPPPGELARGAGVGKILYFDAHSGVAGDMTIAALLDLGVPRRVVDDAVAALDLSGVSIDVHKVWVGALHATRRAPYAA